MEKLNFPTFKFEKEQWSRGVKKIAGVDEVGRGPFAGPVVAAAVIFDPSIELTFNDIGLQKVRDSKLVKEKDRKELSELIKKHALCCFISEISVEKINEFGIGNCSQLAFEEAVKGLKQQPEHILIDAFYIKSMPKEIQTPIIKGDMKSFTIAAASIIAKVYRDELMVKLSKKYPAYKLDKHKGYGTKEHRELIKLHGISEIHRRAFIHF